MAQQQKSGKPWSGANPIPNIHDFVSNLDKGKKDRDKEIDDAAARKAPDSGIVAHKNEAPSQKLKTVTDPTTGKEVQIEDVGKDFMKAVDDPKVGKESTRRLIHLILRQINSCPFRMRISARIL